MEFEKIYIYRIIHLKNLDHILRLGKWTTYNSEDADPDYTGIGEGELIGLRASHEITTVNSQRSFCPSNSYIPFYFAPRSVMLYRIKTGYRVQLVPQEEIVHVVYQLSDILPEIEYLFTDGHGYASLTQWFDDVHFLPELDWQMIRAKQWNPIDGDMDRQRRKQAEFWIKDEIALEKSVGIGVYNQPSQKKVLGLCKKYQRNIPVKIKNDYYY